jgi:oligoendopeptidase F
MQTVGLKAEGVQWNLDELYAGPDDPRIEADLAEARRQAEAFAQQYRGKVSTLDGPGLAHAVEEYERLSELEGRPSFYASLLFAADTQSQKAQQLVHRTREAATETSNILVFFSLDLIALDDNQVAVLFATPEMAEYRHYLETLRRFKPHTLSEKEEQIVNQKNLNGFFALPRVRRW